jgi:hypothetical protein
VSLLFTVVSHPVVQCAVDNDLFPISSAMFACFPLLPAHAHEPQKHTTMSYRHDCPRSGRPRPPRPPHPRVVWLLRGRCDERETAGRQSFELSGPLMRPAGSAYVGCLLASVARRLGAACVPPLPSFLTRTPDRLRRRVMGQHKATTSNTRAGSTGGRPGIPYTIENRPVARQIAQA